MKTIIYDIYMYRHPFGRNGIGSYHLNIEVEDDHFLVPPICLFYDHDRFLNEFTDEFNDWCTETLTLGSYKYWRSPFGSGFQCSMPFIRIPSLEDQVLFKLRWL